MSESQRQKREKMKREQARLAAKEALKAKNAEPDYSKAPKAAPPSISIPNPQRQQELEELFKREGIDFSRPGFYDDPKFLAMEKRDPKTIMLYVEYVQVRVYSDEYLREAETIIRTTAEFIQDVVAKDGRLGACIDASMALARFLEKQGVWCGALTGSLVLSVPNLPVRYFWSLRGKSNTGPATGHAWLIAPPFRVVDVTVALQPYAKGYREALPPLVLAKDVVPDSVHAAEIAEPEVRQDFLNHFRREQTISDVWKGSPQYHRVWTTFGSFTVPLERCAAKYIAISASMPDADLDGMKYLCPSVPNAGDLYRDFEKQGKARQAPNTSTHCSS